MLINMLSLTRLVFESPLHLILVGIISLLFMALETLFSAEGVIHPVLSACAGLDIAAKLNKIENTTELEIETNLARIFMTPENSGLRKTLRTASTHDDLSIEENTIA